MFSMREILVFVAGMVLATVLTVLGTFYFLKNYILLHDSRSACQTGWTQAVAGDQAVIAGLSEHRHLDRLPVREQRQRLVATPRKPITEFLKQRGVGVEDVRHALQ
jgi:hypothetical protein